MNRRDFFNRFALGLGGVALTGLFRESQGQGIASHLTGALGGTHFPPTARRIIYLFMSGAPGICR